jgi:hypothetical protein
MTKLREVLTLLCLLLVIGTLLPLCLLLWRSFEQGDYAIPVELEGTVTSQVHGTVSTKVTGPVTIEQR